ncbi:MAG: iron-sulfur cluster carrier protein ApbC [Wenzhouxiangellaceae bacterium]
MTETFNEADIRRVLAAYVDPQTGMAIGDCVSGVGIDGANVAVDILLGYPLGERRDALAAALSEFLRDHIDGLAQALINLNWRVRAHQVQDKLTPMAGIKNIIAVGSGKGGVGKSTVAANLALALAALGARVGVLDADIHGPSQPRMLGISGQPDTTGDKMIVPMRAHGLQAMSIGLLLGDKAPAIWRGPMVSQALQQLLTQTAWDALDYLIVDLPPGTGDIQLTMAQKVPVSAAVIVTTPQEVALQDARRAVMMFQRVGITTLGVVENMSTYVCSQCGHEEPIFDQGGGQRMATEFDLPLLGQLPLASAVRAGTDAGQPPALAGADDPQAAPFHALANRVAAALARQPLGVQSTGLKFSINT